MSPRTLTRPLDDHSYWRRLLATVHPDRDEGDHELFVFLTAVREYVEGCINENPDGGPDLSRSPWQEPRQETDNKDRIPYPPDADFDAGTREALCMAEELGAFHVYGGVLTMLADCTSEERYAHRESRGASYRQLAAIGHTVGMSAPERSAWYALAKSIPLADRHAGHILGRLKSQAA